jgi:thioredoxin reductase/SAM-dependent methyltransferase
MDVGALPFAVEDQEQLGRSVHGGEGVWDHGCELRRLARVDVDLSFAEPESHTSFEHEEPVMARVYPLVGSRTGRLQAHLHRDRTAVRTTQRPRRPRTVVVRDGSDDDIVVGGCFEERVEADLQRVGQRDEHVEAECPSARLDATDGRGAEVGARGQLIERVPKGGPQAAEARARQRLDLGSHGHLRIVTDLADSAIALVDNDGRFIVVRMTQHPEHHHPSAEPNPVLERHCDVAVIGGSAAGLAAALQISRQRRSVIVVDDGTPRNAPAAHMHGYLGREEVAPSDLRAIGREEVRTYGGEVLSGRVLGVHPREDGRFRLDLSGGHTLVARRVLAATGLTDELPAIDGLAEHWGHGVIHCPFCHGFEVRDQRLVQIVTHPLGLHPTPLFRHLTHRLTVVLHDLTAFGDPPVEALAASGIVIERSAVSQILTGPDGGVSGVKLGDGRVLDADAVVVGPRFSARVDMLAGVGLTPAPHPSGLGDVLTVDPRGETAVPGIYAAGNVTDPSLQVLPSAAQGSQVGAMIAFSLAEDDLRDPARTSGEEADWDQRYGGRESTWSSNPNGTLVHEVTGLAPGRALDVGAGEGADALWLAERGWTVTATDISANALARARAAAERRGLVVHLVRSDANDPAPFDAETFDLVSSQYGSFKRTPDQRGLRNLLRAVAPGGTLLVVHHDLTPLRQPVDVATQTRMYDPRAFVGIDEVAAALTADPDTWHIEIHEPRQRPPGAASNHHVNDIVLRATRRAI